MTYFVLFILLLILVLVLVRLQTPSIFIAKKIEARVLELTPVLSYVRSFVYSGAGGLSSPENLRFGPNRNLFVASSLDIKEYDGASGAFVRDFVSGVIRPVDIVFDAEGNAYVAELSRGVKKFSPTGTLLATFTTMIAEPRGLEMHADGDLLVTNNDEGFPPAAVRNTVTKVNTATGAAVTWATGLVNPQGISRGPDGRYYVCCWGASGTASTPGTDTIKVIDASGPGAPSVSTWNASPVVGPMYLAFSQGSLYVTQSGLPVARFDVQSRALAPSPPETGELIETPETWDTLAHGIAVRSTSTMRRLWRRSG